MNLFRKDPLSGVAIKYKLPLSFVLLCLVAFGVAGYLVANSVYHSLESEILSRLRSESLAQASMFNRTLDALGWRAEDFASDGFIRTRVARLARQRSPEDRASLEQHLRTNKLPLEPALLGLTVVDIEGRELARIGTEQPARPEFASPDQGQGAVQYSALYALPAGSDSAGFSITTPIWNIDHSRQVGYLVCVVDLSRVIRRTFLANEDAIAGTDPGKELTIIDQSGRRVEIPWWFLRGEPPALDAGGRFRKFQLVTAGAGYGASGHAGRHLCTNGEEMFGQSYPMAGSHWTALVELNAGQALEPVTAMEGRLLGTGIIIAVATLILLYFPVQFLIRPLNALTEMAGRIRDGDFSVRLHTDSDDEIGRLTHTFNVMAEAVEDRTNYLEETAADLKASRRALQVEHDRLTTVVQSMQDGLLLLGRDGEVILSNQAARPLQRLLTGQVAEPDLRKCLHDRADGSCRDCLLQPSLEHACVVSFDDAVYEVLSTQLPSVHGEWGKVLVARDITERERMRDQQLHQDRLTVLGKIAAVVAHEMNSPLSAISLYNQMMQTELDEASAFQEHAEVIQRNTDTCRRIIKQLLEYARTPQPEMGPVDLNELITYVLRFLKPFYDKKDAALAYRNRCGNQRIHGDAMQLQQVLVNLLMNAIHALPAEDGRIRITADRRAERLLIEVEDNGHGIPAEIREEIFEPFVTTKNAGGTGLGLSTSRRIIAAHGGSLDLVDTRPGDTVFRITLPANRRGHGTKAPDRPAAAPEMTSLS